MWWCREQRAGGAGQPSAVSQHAPVGNRIEGQAHIVDKPGGAQAGGRQDGDLFSVLGNGAQGASVANV